MWHHYSLLPLFWQILTVNTESEQQISRLRNVINMILHTSPNDSFLSTPCLNNSLCNRLWVVGFDFTPTNQRLWITFLPLNVWNKTFATLRGKMFDCTGSDEQVQPPWNLPRSQFNKPTETTPELLRVFSSFLCGFLLIFTCSEALNEVVGNHTNGKQLQNVFQFQGFSCITAWNKNPLNQRLFTVAWWINLQNEGKDKRQTNSLTAVQIQICYSHCWNTRWHGSF